MQCIEYGSPQQSRHQSTLKTRKGQADVLWNITACPGLLSPGMCAVSSICKRENIEIRFCSNQIFHLYSAVTVVGVIRWS